jgi:hypothetical protein
MMQAGVFSVGAETLAGSILATLSAGHLYAWRVFSVKWITPGLPVICPESIPSAEITRYKPTSRYQSRVSESIHDGVLIEIKVNSHVPEDPP